jgi:hypothetical protein
MMISENRIKEFLAELEHFKCQKESATSNNSLDYNKIEAIFKICRDNATKNLQTAISVMQEKDPDNPVFLGVSLLNILHGTGLRETAHTRLLTWFLNPKENHGFKLRLLQAFLAHITDEEWVMDSTLEVTAIHAERRLSVNGKRTDIWIEGKVHPADAKADLKWLVIVEAKVESTESVNQLPAYEEEATKWSKSNNNDKNKLEPLLVFLTSNNVKASRKKWIPLTFKVLAELLWMAGKNEPEAPGIHLLRHYISGIFSDMYGWRLPVIKSDEPTDIYSLLDFLQWGIQLNAVEN